MDLGSSSGIFTATTASEPTYNGLMEAICNNPLIKWLASQNRFVLLALIVFLILLIMVFRYYTLNLNWYQSQFQYVFKGEKDLTVKETIPDSSITIRPNKTNEYTTLFWLYVSPPSEEFDARENRVIFVRGEMSNPTIAFYINQKLNTLKCSVKVQNDFDIQKTEDLQKFKQLKFDRQPLYQHYLTLSYDQIPVQRWVQVAVVVSQYKAHLYIDNYSVDNRDTSKVLYGCGESDVDLDNVPDAGKFIIAGQVGDIKINPDQDSVSPQKGYIKGLQVFNRAISEEKIQNIYRQNPNTPSEIKFHFNKTFELV